MSPRKYSPHRCEGCGVHRDLCACDEIVPVDLPTRVVIVQHSGERHKPTNTARLAHAMLPNSVIVHWPGVTGTLDDRELIRADLDYRLMFPRDDEAVLTREHMAAPDGRGLAFVILDGTWHQCSRMSRRVPIVREMRCLALPPGPPSIWGVRRQHDRNGLSTMEAVIRALAMVEGPAAVERLQRTFEIVTARLMFLKGRLPTPAVPAIWPPSGGR